MSKNNNLQDFLKDLANTIRTKKGISYNINPQDFSSEISSISIPINQRKEVSLSSNGTSYVYPDSSYTGLSSVKINVEVPNSTEVLDIYVSKNGSSEYSPSSPNIGFNKVRITANVSSVISFNADIETVNDSVFNLSSNISSISIHDGVTKISNYALSGLNNLNTAVLPNSLTSIGSYAFQYCSKLTSINIPENVASIGSYAFDGCSGLTSIIFSEGWKTSIDGGAFRDCTSLASITIPKSVTMIGNYAFDNCTALKKVIIEDDSSTLSLGYNGSSQGLFYDCPLEEVYLGRNLSYSSGSSYGYSPFYNSSPVISLGNNVTSIPSYLFYNNTSHTTLTIPWSVTSIGDHAFDGCTGKLVVNCNIPSGSSSSTGAFYGSRFTKVTFGEGVTNVGSYAFDGCDSLDTITLSSTISSVGTCAFSNTRSASIIGDFNIRDFGSNCFSGCSISCPDNGVIYFRNGETITIGSGSFKNSSISGLTHDEGNYYDSYFVLDFTEAGLGNGTDNPYIPILNDPGEFQGLSYKLKYIYVPKGQLSRWKASSSWSGYSDILVERGGETETTTTTTTPPNGETTTKRP